VNFSLRLATLVEPEKPWRIITSQKHSTVWDGGDTLFDFNFQAFGIDPNECFETAFEKELKLGKYLRVYLPESVRPADHTQRDSLLVAVPAPNPTIQTTQHNRIAASPQHATAA
jgi:hypothetical protein